MWQLDKLVDRKIEEALARGDFDHLEGRGRPLELGDDALVPAELRLAWRILKNAGYLPEEIALRGEVARVEELLALARSGEERVRAARRLSLLRARLDARRGGHGGPGPGGAYRERLLRRLGRGL